MRISSPTKIIAAGLNYKDHAEELNMPLPQEPLIFFKPPSSVIGDGEAIIYPSSSNHIEYEGELAVVIAKQAKNISANEARLYIAGYTCANDITARDLQKRDGQWSRAKGFDTFTPLGPRIASEIDPTNLDIRLLLNGEVKQNSNTNQMVFDVFELVSFISEVMTLLPGDIVLTGTPPGVGLLEEGDVVEVQIEGIGILRNPVQ